MSSVFHHSSNLRHASTMIKRKCCPCLSHGSAIYGGCKPDTVRICCWAPCCCGVLRRRHWCWAPAPSIDQISPARRAPSSNHAARLCCGRLMGQTNGQTDRRTDTRQLHIPCSAYYTDNVNKRVLWDNPQLAPTATWSLIWEMLCLVNRVRYRASIPSKTMTGG